MRPTTNPQGSSSSDCKIRVVQWNLEGSNTISLLPNTIFEDIDVFVAIETWMVKDAPQIPGKYAAHSVARLHDGPGRPSGGVSVYYGERVGQVKVIQQDEDCVILECELMNIVAMYVRPANVASTYDLLDKITGALQKIDYSKNTLLLGDFNTRLDSPEDNRTKMLLSTLGDYGIWPASDPNFKTFNGFLGSSTIDLFFTNMRPGAITYNRDNTPLKEGTLLKWHSHLD